MRNSRKHSVRVEFEFRQFAAVDVEVNRRVASWTPRTVVGLTIPFESRAELGYDNTVRSCKSSALSESTDTHALGNLSSATYGTDSAMW